MYKHSKTNTKEKVRYCTSKQKADINELKNKLQ